MTKSVIASWRISRLQFCIGILVGLAACGSGSDAVSGPGADSSSAEFSRSSLAKIISTVSVTSTSSTVNIGGTLQLAAAALNSLGGAITGNLVTWSSSDTTVLTVSSTGIATPVKPGTASVKATIVGISGSKTITVAAVAPGTVANLAVAAVNDTSATLTFTAMANGAGGAATADIRFAVAPLQWGSAASVTRGTCTTPVAGTTVGSTVTCTVLGLTPGTAYNFELVTFRGTLNLNAVFGNQSNVAAGTTTVPVVASVTVTPATATLNVGAKQALVATVKDKSNNVMTGKPVTWTSSNTAIATIDSTGTITGVAAGAATFTATVAGVSGTATATVAAQAVGTVTNLAVAAVNDTAATLTFTQVTDGAGGAAAADIRFAPAPLQWASATSVTRGTCKSPLAGAIVGSKVTCTVLGLTPGKAYNFALTAFRGTLSANAVFGNLSNIAAATTTVTAVVPTVASVTVTPATASSNVGTKLALVATVRDQNNNVMTGKTIAWASSNSAVGTVDATGSTMGVIPGTVTFTATVAGIKGTAAVTETAVAQPPQSGQYTNQPAGLTRFAEINFSALPGAAGLLGTVAGNFYTQVSPAAHLAVLSDPTALLSPSVLQVDFEKGTVPGYDVAPGDGYRQFGGWDKAGALSNTEYSEYYEATDFKIPTPDFETQEVGVKILGYWGVGNNNQSRNTGSGPTELYSVMRGSGGGTSIMSSWNLDMYTQGISSTRLPQNMNLSTKITAGSWHHFETYMKLNSMGQSNGVWKWWLDGVLIGDYENIQFINAAQPSGFFGRSMDLVWGGQGGTAKTRTDHVWFNHMYMSGVFLRAAAPCGC